MIPRTIGLALVLPALLLGCADAAPEPPIDDVVDLETEAPDATREEDRVAPPVDDGSVADRPAFDGGSVPDTVDAVDAVGAVDAPGLDARMRADVGLRDAFDAEAEVAEGRDVSAMGDVVTVGDAPGMRDAPAVGDVPDAARPPPAEGYDVFLLAGQSNMVGRGAPGNATLDAIDPMAFQWGRFGGNDGRIIPATARLDHNDSLRLDRVGLGLAFAKAYLTATGRARRVLLVPTARGGTSFSANEWNPGDALFEDAVARANAAMRSHPDNRFQGILWHQGEADVGRLSTTAYATALDRLIYRFRGRVTGAATAPFIVGEFCPDWRPTGSAAAVTAALRATPMRVPFTAVAPAMGLRGNVGDTIHFDAPAMRAYGPRYAMARVMALANVATEAPPGAPTALGAVPEATTMTLNWQAATAPAMAPVLGYRVALRRASGGAWTEQYTPGLRATFTALAPATEYEMQVVAQNRAGLGPVAMTRAMTRAR